MDNLERANRIFQELAYEHQGRIDVDRISEDQAKAALKRVIGMATANGAMKYVTAAKEAIEEAG